MSEPESGGPRASNEPENTSPASETNGADTGRRSDDVAFAEEEVQAGTLEVREPDPLEVAKAEAAKYREQLLRTAADFENFRKRTRREVDDATRKGKEQALKDLLPVFDNVERAIASSEAAPDVKSVLELHPYTHEDYLIGAFLVGAYQEILGDLHNLFGDTHAVHVSLGDAGNVILESVIKGDTVREVLNYVQFDSDVLVRKLHESVEAAVVEGRMNLEESGRLLRFYEDGLQGYTYLEDPSER